MDWYRVTFVVAGRKKIPIELQAHCAGDAAGCALVKAKLHTETEDQYRLTDLECIDEPSWVREATRAAENMVRE